MRIVLCSIGWLKYYQGCDFDGEYSTPLNGGSFNKDEEGLESRNFRNDDGFCYGYVEPPGRGIRFHLSKNFNLEHDVDKLAGVTVIWVANAKYTPMKRNKRIIGWYKNATFYENSNEKEGRFYYFKARAEDCVCLPENERDFIVEHKLRNILYYRPDLDAEFKKYLNYTEGYAKIEFVQFSGDSTETIYTEGISRHRMQEYKTRNYTVVQKAKERHRQKNNGSLPCEVCGFDFEEVYGDLGEGFIEAHHNVSHAKQSNRIIRERDFSLVCSNCHEMLHKGSNLTVADLKTIYSKIN